MSLLENFPELRNMTLESLTKEQVEEWVARKLWDSQYWNNVIGTWLGVYKTVDVSFPAKITLRRIKKNVSVKGGAFYTARWWRLRWENE
jgi:hypothetical protein